MRGDAAAGIRERRRQRSEEAAEMLLALVSAYMSLLWRFCQDTNNPRFCLDTCREAFCLDTCKHIHASTYMRAHTCKHMLLRNLPTSTMT
jgi:hypothetical protein